MNHAATFDGLNAFRLDGDVAVVTGGASGIGAAIAKGLAQAGAQVVIADRNDEAGKHQVAAIRALDASASVDVQTLDVASEESVRACVKAIADRFGSIDVLINNAGMAIRRPSVDLPLDEWNQVLNVNMTGVFLCAREVVRRYSDGTDSQSTRVAPRIVNMASIMGLSGGGIYANPSYQATKGAVVNMTRAMAVEWAELGVRVNAIAPTWVRTPFIAGLLENPELVAKLEAMTPLGCLAEPEDIVGAALFLASRASRMVTGHTLAVDGGFLAQ